MLLAMAAGACALCAAQTCFLSLPNRFSSSPLPCPVRVPLRAAFTLSTAVTSSVISAWLTAWVGSWWGVNAYHLLQLPEEWGSVQAALPSWVAWTVPYLGATLGEPGVAAVLAG